MYFTDINKKDGGTISFPIAPWSYDQKKTGFFKALEAAHALESIYSYYAEGANHDIARNFGLDENCRLLTVMTHC